MRLAGMTALVTGGSSGIGAATARALAAAGVIPLIAGRDQVRLREVAGQTGGVALLADLAAPDGPEQLARAALRAAGETSSGGIDVLVNNAGVGWAGPLPEIAPAKVAELVTVNLTAPMQLTRLLARPMMDRRRGTVVFVSSIAGVAGVRGEAVYAATKAGIAHFADSLGYELDGCGVRVCVVVPGVIATPFFDRRGKPYARKRPAPVPAERVADAIVSALARDRAYSYVPGWLRAPARLHGAAPGVFRFLATRFGNGS